MGEVDIASITVPHKRHREMRDIAQLASSMREVGLLHPITITAEKRLISGLHRLRAAESLGWKRIDAKTLTGDELDAELAEIDENLISNRLTRAEEAHHIARREQLLKARGGRATQANNQHSAPATVAGAPKTTEDLARDAGMSKRTYELRAKIGRGLTEETLEIISEVDPNDCDLPNSTRQLNYLAGVDDTGDQMEIARRVATGEAVSVWKASDQLKEEREDLSAGERQMLAMNSGMKRMGDKDDETQDPATLVRIRRASGMAYVVEWSDGTASTMSRKAIIEEHEFRKCKHCLGYGVVEKKG